MSWLFSLALVEESSAGTYLVGELSQPWSGTLTPLAFLSHDKTTNFSRLSRFGVTFRPLMDDLGEELLMSYLAGFHAKTSVLPGKVQASRAHGPECGGTWPASLARFDPVSFSWKTAQLSLLGDSELSSVTWPRSGMTANGQCWELPTLERRTSETGFGLWRTPTVGMINADRAKDPEYTARKEAKGQTITLADQVRHKRLWPTPTCPNGGRSVAHVTDWRSERTAYTANGKKVQVDLAQAVKRWATPTVCGNYNRAGASPTSGDGLATQAGGALNPTWVEWLMGWPLGWTDLKPLGTGKSHCAQPKHSDS